jgi:hypothetical protein
MKKQVHGLLKFSAPNYYFQNLFSSREKIRKNQKLGQIQFFKPNSRKKALKNNKITHCMRKLNTEYITS